MDHAVSLKNKGYLFNLNYQKLYSELFLVDTGASVSAVDYRYLLPALYNDVAVEYIEGADSQSIVANGTSVSCNLCCIANVKISGKRGQLFVPKFYVTVLTGTQERKTREGEAEGLLGYDFVDCCDYSHSNNDVFKIQDFDYTNYSNLYTNLIKDKHTLQVTMENFNRLFGLGGNI